ncbi:hypothetical protein [Hydrogenophaga sp. 5NK40-0174]|uniref:hypothetical protein n=1 Tax=Hydrogenophaga sp. 5NK40-0174 TaxID=3127649 RepID=UPI0031057AE8
MSTFSEALKAHFQARTAGQTPPPRLKNPVISGPHRLGDSGYSFTVKQDRNMFGAVAVVWTPTVPPATVVDAYADEYATVMATVLPAIAHNLPHGGVESWA